MTPSTMFVTSVSTCSTSALGVRARIRARVRARVRATPRVRVRVRVRVASV